MHTSLQLLFLLFNPARRWVPKVFMHWCSKTSLISTVIIAIFQHFQRWRKKQKFIRQRCYYANAIKSLRAKTKSEQSVWELLLSHFTVVKSKLVVMECVCLCTAMPPLLFCQFSLPANDKQTQQPRNSRVFLPLVSWETRSIGSIRFSLNILFDPVAVFSQHLNSLKWWKYLRSTNTTCLTSFKTKSSLL